MQRIRTALVGVPLILAVIYFLPIWLFAVVVAVIGVLALQEFLALRPEPLSDRPSSSSVSSRWLLIGMVYVGMPMGCLIALSRPDEVFLLLGIVWVGDTAAYYVGRTFGRRKLAPRISPNKTVEGAVGGLMASVLVSIALGNAWLGLSLTWLVPLGVTVAVAGQLGDLTESAVKRRAGVKDSSGRLPGHGGVLDRVDSLLFAAPVFLLMARI